MKKGRQSIYDVAFEAGYAGKADYPEAHGLCDLGPRGRGQFIRGYSDGEAMARAGKVRMFGGAA